jgi:predicted nucleic acid-binding Zn ribbon protein
VSDPRRRRPAALGDVLSGFLERSGLAERVEQAALLPEWPELVGPQIAAVTEPRSVSADGTLWVAVRTHAWMSELSLLEPELLRKLAARPLRSPIRRIRWQLGG